MKILYAIQGTGNGHLSRARAIIPHLMKRGEVDLLVSGIQSDIPLPWPVKYQFRGMSFIFGKKGGVDFMNTYRKTKLKQFWKEVNSLPVENYDLVLNDFEPVSAWACQRKRLPCIGLSNQLAVLSPDAPQAKHEDVMGKFILRYYAPVTAAYGIHFQRYNQYIYTPIIRDEVRNLSTSDEGHYTVYLPAYSDERIMEVLSEFPDMNWQVFSKHNQELIMTQHVVIRPINDKQFLQSMATCSGVLCAAGFATPSEALYLGKKLMVVPMKKQFEQHCNAAALKEMGIPVLKSLKMKHAEKIEQFIESTDTVKVDWPDVSSEIVQRIFDDHLFSTDNYTAYLTRDQFMFMPA